VFANRPAFLRKIEAAQYSLRVVALFSAASGPRNVPNTPSSVGLLTPNQCFSLMK
jgi:hypothetical protein